MNDRFWVILTAEKGVAMEELDKWQCINEAQDLLGQSDNYKTLVVDPTNKEKR